MEGNKQLDLDKMTDTLAPEDSTVGGLLVPGKVVFRPQKKSVLGLDMLADAKRIESKVESSFKVPKERVAPVAAYQDEGEEMSVSMGAGEVENDSSSSLRSYSNRRYRDSASSDATNSDCQYRNITCGL